MSLLLLPDELKLEILGKLNEHDLVRICEVNHDFQRLCQDRHLWMELVRRRFGKQPEDDPYQQYKRLFNGFRTLTPRQILISLLAKAQDTWHRLHDNESIIKLFQYNGLNEEIDIAFGIIEKLRQLLNKFKVDYIDDLHTQTDIEKYAREYGRIYFKLPEYYDDITDTYKIKSPPYEIRTIYNLVSKSVTFLLLMGIDPNMSDSLGHFIDYYGAMSEPLRKFIQTGKLLQLALSKGYTLCNGRTVNLYKDLSLTLDIKNIRDIDLSKLFQNCHRLSDKDLAIFLETRARLNKDLDEFKDELSIIKKNMTEYIKDTPYYRDIYPNEQPENIKGHIVNMNGQIKILYTDDDYWCDLKDEYYYEEKIYNLNQLLRVIDNVLQG